MSRLSSKLPILAASALVVLFATQPTGAETPQAACDRLAAHPSDPMKPSGVEGVPTGEIEVATALAACKSAVDATPGEPRLHYELGRVYFDQSDYGGAFREFSVASQADYPAAAGALGYLYDAGLGTAVDVARALALYQRGADGNVGFAAHNLAVMLREGTGTPVDHVRSLQYFRKAVALGYRQSLVDVGFAYDNGHGVAQDYAEAMRWYRQAAEDDIPEALNNIGNLYENGHGVDRDFGEALRWYKKAEGQDYALAFVNTAHMLDAGQGLTPDPEAAAANILTALEKGSAEEDAFNIRYIFDEATWTPAFWTAIQKRLAEGGHYGGPIDGTPSGPTQAAVKSLIGD